MFKTQALQEHLKTINVETVYALLPTLLYAH
jgi:hypothetical protein